MKAKNELRQIRGRKRGERVYDNKMQRLADTMRVPYDPPLPVEETPDTTPEDLTYDVLGSGSIAIGMIVLSNWPVVIG